MISCLVDGPWSTGQGKGVDFHFIDNSSRHEWGGTGDQIVSRSVVGVKKEKESDQTRSNDPDE